MDLYRGFNSKYQNYGIPMGQNHIWTTNDLEYAHLYNDKVVRFSVDENELNVADSYDVAKILDDYDFDPIDIDNDIAQMIIDSGYNCVYFETQSSVDVFVLLDKNLIKSATLLENKMYNSIVLNEEIDESINDILRIAK